MKTKFILGLIEKASSEKNLLPDCLPSEPLNAVYFLYVVKVFFWNELLDGELRKTAKFFEDLFPSLKHNIASIETSPPLIG